MIVADGGSSDATAALATPFAHVVQSRRGRARQMNAGAQLAHGDLLLFQHADTRLPPGALTLVEATMADPQVVGGAFALRFDQAGWLYTAIACSTNWRSRLRHSYTGDQAIFVRAQVFRALGGYADIPLMEDVEICRRLRHDGALRFLTTAVLVSARRHRRYGPLRVVTTGWVYQMLYALGMPTFALHWLYYGHLPD
ncbi:MAG: TIGR04283 family arsenosugar biosynthesis glycosyltransferase [Roseiflexaceae bacterium]